MYQEGRKDKNVGKTGVYLKVIKPLVLKLLVIVGSLTQLQGLVNIHFHIYTNPK